MQISIIRSKTQAINTSTPTNYTNVSYDSWPCKMASATVTMESNDRWRHRDPKYCAIRYTVQTWGGLHYSIRARSIGWLETDNVTTVSIFFAAREHL